MDHRDVKSFADRARAIAAASPPTSASETRSWLLEPFLETLGWDVHGPDCRTDLTVADARLEYVLLAASTPAMFVAAESYTDPLEADRLRRLQTAMTRTGVDRALYTNGDALALLAGTDGADRFDCSLESVHEHADALAHFTKRTADRRLERHTRRHAARRLAVSRAELASTIADSLASTAGESYRSEFRRASDRFVDSVVADLLDAASTSAPDGLPGRSPDPAEATGGEPDADDRLALSAHAPTDDTTSTAQQPPDDGEYVVRFFADRGSIGAIGHSSPADATVHAAEYLLERGLAGVRTPWEPDDDTTVLNDEPMLADGSPMPAFERLSNGLFLNTAGGVDVLAARVVALTERAGLRAMLTGDWSGETV